MLVFTMEDIEKILIEGLTLIVYSKEKEKYRKYCIKELLASTIVFYQKSIQDKKKYSQLGAIGVALMSMPTAKYLDLDYLAPDGIGGRPEISISKQYILERYHDHVLQAVRCSAKMASIIIIQYGIDYNYKQIINDIIAGIVYRDINDKHAFDDLCNRHDEYDSDTEIKNDGFDEDD